ncbi:MAG: Methyltransferase type 12 [Frankiales bacterium]|jgi:SAM-dependent methyltransferase|nr:Methyltransferase type 12 [Frankiales bacterium]
MASHDHEASVEAVRSYFDAFGEGEWERLAESPAGRVSFELHRRLLARFVRPGMRVLEVGAGPGRFTVELAALGARVVVTDLSPVQLELNAAHVAEAGAEQAVEARALADVCDLNAYGTAEFDAAVAYGGPISYAFDRAGDAVGELLRVVAPGGPVLASVMSTLGAYRQFLPGVVGLMRSYGPDATDRILHTGDLRETQPPGSGQHLCRMFRHAELVALVHAQGGRVLDALASNWGSLADPEALAELEADPALWARFLDNEEECCREPGALDGGTHLLVALARYAVR